MSDFFKPLRTIEAMHEVSREIQTSENKIILHGFSIGAFCVAALQVNATNHGANLENVGGVIWDSIVVGTKVGWEMWLYCRNWSSQKYLTTIFSEKANF